MAISISAHYGIVQQDVANNRSLVRFWVTATSNSGSWNQNGMPGTVTFGGNITGSEGFTGRIGQNQSVNVYVSEKWVGHNADGTCYVEMSASMNTQVSSGVVSARTAGWLTTIPRASQPSCVTYPNHTEDVGDLGETITIHMNRASSAFTHTVTYEFGKSSGTIGTGVKDNVAWTMPLALANQIPSAASGYGTITVKTYNGSQLIGTKSCRFKASVPASVKPSVSDLELSDPTGLLGTYGAYVQGKSTLRVKAACAGSYGSTINKLEVRAGGRYLSNTDATALDFEALGVTGKQTVAATVSDSRGRQGSRSEDVTFAAYSNPSLSGTTARRWNVSTGREDDESSTVRVHVQGSITDVNGKGINEGTVKVEHRAVDAPTWTADDTRTTGASWSYDVYVSGVSANSRFDFRVTVTDSLGTSAVWTTVVETAKPVMDFRADGTGVALMKVAESSDVIDCGVPVIMRRGIKYLDVPVNSDLNDYKTPGFYQCTLSATARTIKNCPTTEAFNMTVFENNTGQEVRQYGNGKTYFRFYQDWDPVGWSTWFETPLLVKGETLTLPSNLIASHVYLRNNNALAGYLTSGGTVSMLRMNASNQVELNWTSGGLKGRVRKTLWSGTANAGATITVPDLAYYNQFIFFFSDNPSNSCVATRINAGGNGSYIAGVGGYGDNTSGAHRLQTVRAQSTSATALKILSVSGHSIWGRSDTEQVLDSISITRIEGLL